MPDEFSPRPTALDIRSLYDLSTIEKPTIKILLYTDAPSLVTRSQTNFFGVGRMIDQLQGHAPSFAKLVIRLEARYSPGSSTADRKINVVLDEELKKTGEPFDQIWFFGLHQINKEKLEKGLGGGGPESELDKDEVSALKYWMDDGGGVLVTGDHANPRPQDAQPAGPKSHCPDPFPDEPFLSLGRALGRCIPRAGLMRDWEGSPTSSEDDSNNTQIVTFGLPTSNFEDQVIFQLDTVPQQLVLQLFADGGPHPVFFYRPGLSIQLFPDHIHEGQVTLPKNFEDEEIWKKDSQKRLVEPKIIAFGIDKRSGKKFSLLAAYDGDDAGVGRIVSDSSWHHYFNPNLSKFTFPGIEGSPSDQIGQFYGNLALWLSPLEKRRQMADAMFRWLIQQPHIVEDIGPVGTASRSNKLRAGRLSNRLLSLLASQCEIHELLKTVVPESYRDVEPSGAFFLPEATHGGNLLPTRESLFGSMLNNYPREPVESQQEKLWAASRNRTRESWNSASREAFEEHFQAVAETAKSAEKFLARLKNL